MKNSKRPGIVEEGRIAAWSGKMPTTCPYTLGSRNSKAWQEGYGIGINQLLSEQEESE